MKNAISSTKSTSKYNNTIIIFKGIIFAFVLTLILLFILALILTYTNIQDTIVPVATIIVTAISILIGSSISTILNGGIIGIVYIFTIYLISSVIEVGFSLNIKSVIMILIGIISGVIGRNCRCKFKQIDILTKKNIYNKMNKKQN